MATLPESYIMVAAIDFGTTYSAYAFSFKSSKEDIKLNKNWGELLGFQSNKTPTTVLTKGNDEFLAFGFEAEDKFLEAYSDESSDIELNLYRHFKMVLHRKQKLTTKTAICSTTGKIIPAIYIFTLALRFLKDHLLQELSKELASSPDPSKIRWVITVPAIWSDDSKQFMREAAYRSGCITSRNSKQLVIALEPEAASFFCRQMDLTKFEDSSKKTFPVGTRYLILDCGGGTNDMVFHEIVQGNKIRELSVPTGGSLGGTKVDEKFITFLEEILSKTFIETFKKEHPSEWFTFLTTFERAKRVVRPDGKCKMNIQLPWSMHSKYAAMNGGESLEKRIKSVTSKGVSFSNGTLVLHHEIVKSLFDDVMHSIVQAIKHAIERVDIQSFHFIFMVGGFSESLFLQNAVKTNFGINSCKVVIPNEAQLAVIKGAVLFGHEQEQITSRIASHTYGIGRRIPFDPKVHDIAKRYVARDGDVLCKDVLIALVEYGDELRIGFAAKHTTVLKQNQQDTRWCIYSLPRKPQKPVEYTSAPDAKYLGEIKLDMSDTVGKRNRKVLFQMIFGGTEVLAEAYDLTTGYGTTSTIVDLLPE